MEEKDILEMIEKKKAEHVQKCQAELVAVLAKFKCELIGVPVIVNGAIAANVMIRLKEG